MNHFASDQQQASTDDQKGPFGVTLRSAKKMAAIFVVCLVIVRLVSEVSMMRAYGSDPQMPIWWMFCAAELAFWLGTGAIIVAFMILFWQQRRVSWIWFIFLVLWGCAIGCSSWAYSAGASALADAANPSTSPKRLHDLVGGYRGYQAGAQLDIYLAENPNTAPEDLRRLAFRPYSGSTDSRLAANSNTPVDILEKFLAGKDPYVWNGLARNPKLPESIEKELAKSTDPAIHYLLEHRGDGT